MNPAPLFQACIGPSQNKLHIRALAAEHKLTLCGTTAVFRDYRGAAFPHMLCRSCLKKMFTVIGDNTLTAELIGVREFDI